MKTSRSKYATGDQIDVSIDRLVAGGSGLARGSDGVVFVDGAAPGDVARVAIDSYRGGTAHARIAQLLEPGPGRVEPPCPWYGRCGGCDFQHLEYDVQLASKVEIVHDSLRRVGGIELDAPITVHAAPRPFGSRARIELHSDLETCDVGFFERRSQRIVPIDHCMVCTPELNSAIKAVRQNRQPPPRSIHLLGANGSTRSDPVLPPIEGGSIWIRIGEFDYLADPAAFFQSSFDLLPAMIESVVASAGPDRSLAMDLFCGVGLFSLPLARNFLRLLAVDNDSRSIRNAAKSAERNLIGNVSFASAEVYSWFGNRKRADLRPDLVVVDPPRSGLERTLTHLLVEREVERLTYVSCDPSTLARDLRILTSGSLGITEVAVFDLFPQTHHIETVVRLAAG